MDGKKPCILIIDDNTDQVRADFAITMEDDVIANVLHPDEIKSTHLEGANLVLVDYRLDKWRKRDSQSSIAFQLRTGMALAVVLREYIDSNTGAIDNTTAFALHTAHLDDIRGRLPALTAEHVLARFNNLEWVFSKTEERRFEQMNILAKAVQRLHRTWPQNLEDSAKSIKILLNLNEDAPWADRCWQEVRDSRIPAYEMSTGGYGIQFIRWMLHQVMPYPCFLWEKHWVAARLHISVDSLCRVVNGNSKLAQDLRKMRYSGMLADFLGGRWWRGALEDYVWELTQGNKTIAELLNSLRERADEDLESIVPNPAIVNLDVNFRPKNYFTTPLEAVRIQPDHWPAFADTAWMEIEDVKHKPENMAIVDPLDFAIFNSNNDG